MSVRLTAVQRATGAHSQRGIVGAALRRPGGEAAKRGVGTMETKRDEDNATRTATEDVQEVFERFGLGSASDRARYHQDAYEPGHLDAPGCESFMTTFSERSDT